jgi:hypothetical protein
MDAHGAHKTHERDADCRTVHMTVLTCSRKDKACVRAWLQTEFKANSKLNSKQTVCVGCRAAGGERQVMALRSGHAVCGTFGGCAAVAKDRFLRRPCI